MLGLNRKTYVNRQLGYLTYLPHRIEKNQQSDEIGGRDLFAILE